MVVAVLTWEHVRKVGEPVDSNQLVFQSKAVMHFTDRYFDLLKEGNPERKVMEEPGWMNKFWSLHATEFYFFHHGMLPIFMYSLWMVELAKMYSGVNGEAVWKSHANYLALYSLNYEQMGGFFEHLYKESKTHNDETITKWIKAWISENQKAMS
jgi:hypothetical protein